MTSNAKAVIDVDSRDNIERTANEGLRYIKIAGVVLGGFVTWHQLRDIPIIELVQKTNAQYVQRILLVIWYYSWVAGTAFDVQTQKVAFLEAPRRVRFSSIIAVVALILVAAALFATKDNQFWFAIALAVFLLVNLMAWLHIRKRVRPAIQSSRSRYNEASDFVGLEKLFVVSDYIVGQWQWFRFIAMGLLVTFLDIVVISKTANAGIAHAINLLLPDLSIPLIETLTAPVIFLTFIITAESWIWWKRISVRLSQSVIVHIGRAYRLSRLSS